MSGYLARQNWLVDRDRQQRDALLARGHQLRDVGKSAGRDAGVGIIDEADLIRRDVAAEGHGGSCDGNLGRTAGISFVLSAGQPGVGDKDRYETENQRNPECDH